MQNYLSLYPKLSKWNKTTHKQFKALARYMYGTNMMLKTTFSGKINRMSTFTVLVQLNIDNTINVVCVLTDLRTIKPLSSTQTAHTVQTRKTVNSVIWETQHLLLNVMCRTIRRLAGIVMVSTQPTA